jgi:hypothetical protein
VREGRRSLGGPLVPLSHGAPPYIPKLKTQRSRLSRDCGTATGGISSRSIRSHRRRAARERWSSSTLGTLSLQRLVLIMAPSTARTPPAKTGGGAAPIARRSPKMCEPLHIAGDSFCGGGRAAGHRPSEQVTDRAEPLPHARRGKLACRPSARQEGRIAGLDSKISFNSDQKSIINCPSAGMLPIELQISH